MHTPGPLGRGLELTPSRIGGKMLACHKIAVRLEYVLVLVLVLVHSRRDAFFFFFASLTLGHGICRAETPSAFRSRSFGVEPERPIGPPGS